MFYSFDLLLLGLCYGLGVGPVPFVAMSSLFPQVRAFFSMSFIQVLYLTKSASAEKK